MYARVASFEGGDNERLRQMAEERRGSGAMMPEFFDSKDQIAAAEQTFDQMGDEIPDDVRGRRTSVDVYEVAWDEEV